MTIKYRLLMFLNPDATCVADVAEYLYGIATEEDKAEKNKATVRAYVNVLRDMGWGIFHKTYQITGDQYELLLKCQQLKLDPGEDRMLTPDGLRKLVELNEQTKKVG